MKKILTTFLSAGLAGAAITPSYAQQKPDVDFVIDTAKKFNNRPLFDGTSKDKVFLSFSFNGKKEFYEVIDCFPLVTYGTDPSVEYMRKNFQSAENLKAFFNRSNINLDTKLFDMDYLRSRLEHIIEEAKNECSVNLY